MEPQYTLVEIENQHFHEDSENTNSRAAYRLYIAVYPNRKEQHLENTEERILYIELIKKTMAPLEEWLLLEDVIACQFEEFPQREEKITVNDFFADNF